MVFWFIIEHTMLPIFALVLIGFGLDRKFGIDVKTLSKVMFYQVIPSFIFTKVYSTDFPPGSLSLIANIFIFMVICFGLANIVSKIRHYDEGMIQSCRNALMFNNTGNLGVAPYYSRFFARSLCCQRTNALSDGSTRHPSYYLYHSKHYAEYTRLISSRPWPPICP